MTHASLVGLSDVKRFVAVDGQQLDRGDVKVNLFRQSLTRGAVGCALSHYMLWCQLLSDVDHDMYAIFEDDVIFLDGFNERYKSLINEQIPKLGKMGTLWNIIWLGYIGPEWFSGKRLAGPSTIAPMDEYRSGTFSYLISKQGARILVQMIKSGKCTRTIDSWLSYFPSSFFMRCKPCLCWSDVANNNLGKDTDVQHDRNLVSGSIMYNVAPVEDKSANAPVVRIGTMNGAHPFAWFIASLTQRRFFAVAKLSPAIADVDIIVDDLTRANDNGKREDFRPLTKLSVSVQVDPCTDCDRAGSADVRICCYIPAKRSGLAPGSIVDQTNNMWYVPRWVTSFNERKNTQHMIGTFLSTSCLPPPKPTWTMAKFCAFLYNKDVPDRNRFYDLLNAYKPVDALGRCKNKSVVVNENSHDNWSIHDSAVQKYEGYKFVIAFEKVRECGYITEKLINPRLCKHPPIIIYFGAPDVGKYFNQESFIDVQQFKDFSAAIDFIKRVDNDDALYQQIYNQPFMTTTQSTNLNVQSLSTFVIQRLNKSLPKLQPTTNRS
jgi:GR25 family glycosyltransferase involved in LPS biosynthesis